MLAVSIIIIIIIIIIKIIIKIIIIIKTALFQVDYIFGERPIFNMVHNHSQNVWTKQYAW